MGAMAGDRRGSLDSLQGVRGSNSLTSTPKPAPMGSGLVKGVGGPELPGGALGGWLLVLAGSVGRRRGQGGAPNRTNDLDADESRRRMGWREGPDDLGSWLACTHSGPWVRMTVESGPGCSL
jgi:hypothetical protein